MRKYLIIFLLLATIVIGCNTTGVITPTAMPHPSSTLTPFVSKTKTLIPTLTSIPTKTPTVVPTLNATQEVVSTIFKSTAVVEATQTFIAQEAIQTAKLDLNNDCNAWHISLSPDKKWLARDCQRDNVFRVSKIDGSMNFEISHEEISNLVLEDSSNAYVGDVFPLFWSSDGRFLFFSEDICCVDTDAYGSSDSLFRLNLQTGAWSEVISGGANYFKFSLLGQKLIHIPNDISGAGMPVIINIIDLETWSQEHILLNDNEQAGSVVWSPDENNIVLVAKTGNVYDDNQKFSIIVLDLIKKSSRVISYPDYMYPVNWFEDNIIVLLGVSCIKDNPYSCYDVFLFYDMNLEKFISSP